MLGTQPLRENVLNSALITLNDSAMTLYKFSDVLLGDAVVTTAQRSVSIMILHQCSSYGVVKMDMDEVTACCENKEVIDVA
jgi:uncharacterized protein YerC